MLYACHSRHLNRDINIMFYVSVAAADVPHVRDNGDDDDDGFSRSNEPNGKDMNWWEGLGRGSWLAGLQTNFLIFFLIFFDFRFFLFLCVVFTA